MQYKNWGWILSHIKTTHIFVASVFIREIHSSVCNVILHLPQYIAVSTHLLLIPSLAR